MLIIIAFVDNYVLCTTAASAPVCVVVRRQITKLNEYCSVQTRCQAMTR
jgi:hypothetical protein